MAPLALVFTIFVVYFVNAGPIRASLTLIDSLRSYPEGPSKNLELFKKALAYNSFGSTE
ncbi:MAG: hypothetical protein RLY23_1244, partial [Actinomycetota bacterium]